ncbi:hypothetical protein D1872_195060 [compost metagenome]
MVNLAVKCITVDILGDVFSDIPRRTALVHVLGFKPVFCRTSLVTVLFQGIASHDIDDVLTLLALAKQHHVPVRRTVMVWLNDAHTVNAQVIIFKRGAHFLPDADKIPLAVFR